MEKSSYRKIKIGNRRACGAKGVEAKERAESSSLSGDGAESEKGGNSDFTDSEAGFGKNSSVKRSTLLTHVSVPPG